MKAVRHHGGGDDVDVGRQFVVDTAAEEFRSERCRDVEVRDLRERVHAGVGSSRSVELEVRAARRRADRAVDLALHRPRVLLDLPAAVAGSRVFDRQLEPRHVGYLTMRRYNAGWMTEESAPRLLITDPLGKRIVSIDKPLFTIGRRTETDLRLAGADISRLHAEITVEDGVCTLHDKQSRFGTFINGERVTDRALVPGDRLRFGQAGDTEVTFVTSDDAPSVERSAISAAGEFRQMAVLLEGLRALGSGRVLDEVLALVLDSAIEVTGAERGFIMLADRGRSSSSSWRARVAR